MQEFTIFISGEIHQWLLGRCDATMEFNVKQGVNIQYDVIEEPFHCEISTDAQSVQLKVYIRSEIGAFLDEPDLGITFFESGADPQIINSGRIGNDVVQMAEIFMQGGFKLYECFKSSELAKQTVGFDAKTEGVIAKLEEDVLHFEKVSGKGRPDLACTTLFGGVQMSRPYEDEVMNSWLMDLIPFEDQLEAAEQGDEDAMLEVATTYLNGDIDSDVEPDAEKAVYWFQKLAELDNPTGQFNLAVQYVKGEGVEHSFEKALYWMQKAEKNGDVDAASHIEKYQVILNAIDKANVGDANAMAILSEQYMNIGANIGDEHEESFFAKSFAWAQKAAEKNNLEGTYLLGLSYEHGRGTDIDKKKAVEAYQKAAEMGHDKSQWNLAASYIQGMGIEKNIELAQYWAEKSAEQGYLLAVRGLFVMTEDFFEGDLAKKMEKLESLAQQCPNDAEIYHRLALDYMEEDEEGNMYNLDRAIYWFKLAGENGHQMSGEQYHLWSYIKKIKQEGVVPDNGDYLGYVIENGLLGEALSYEPEN